MNTLAALFSTIQAMYPELTEENILLHGVLPGPINTDMNAGLKIEMVSPESVANAILDGIVNEDEDIFLTQLASR